MRGDVIAAPSCCQEEVGEAFQVHHNLRPPEFAGPVDAVHKHDGHLRARDMAGRLAESVLMPLA